MILTALQAAIVEPPVNLLVLAWVGVLLARGAGRRRRWRAGGGLLVCLALGGLTVLAMPATGWLLLTALERNLPVEPPAGRAPQAIVVLSADDLRAVPGGIVGPADVGALTLERLRAAARLHRRTGLPILVSGGSVSSGAPPIAYAMAHALRVDFATPVQWVEDASTTTWENARFSAVVLAGDGVTSVYLVTEAWHMKRAVLSFERFGQAATAAPTHFTGPAGLGVHHLVPGVRGWVESGQAMHEWIGLLWYRLRP